MNSPTPLFVGIRKAAQLLDMSLIEFRSLVETGSLPPPVMIGGRHARWHVARLEAILSGSRIEDEFET